MSLPGWSCLHGPNHTFINGICWFCDAKDPSSKGRYQFRRTATETFGWTIKPDDFAKLR